MYRIQKRLMSQIFDDPMAYEGHSIGGEITRLLPVEFVLKTEFYYHQKKYSAKGIYVNEDTYDEKGFREDIHKTARINLKKNFNLNFDMDHHLVLRLEYQWIDNKSNSYWEDYTSQSISLGLEFQF